MLVPALTSMLSPKCNRYAMKLNRNQGKVKVGEEKENRSAGCISFDLKARINERSLGIVWSYPMLAPLHWFIGVKPW